MDKEVFYMDQVVLFGVPVSNYFGDLFCTDYYTYDEALKYMRTYYSQKGITVCIEDIEIDLWAFADMHSASMYIEVDGVLELVKDKDKYVRP